MAQSKTVKYILSLRQDVTKSLGTARKGIDAFNKSVGKGNKLYKSTARTLGELGGAYLSFRALKSLATDASWTAAKVEMLNGALYHLGKISNINKKYLDIQKTTIKSLGITTEDTNATMADFLKTQLDITKAAPLARVAQDAAVLAGETTSQAIKGITRGVVTLMSRTLRNHGVFVNIEKVVKEYSKTLGKTTAQMSLAEKQQAVLNAVLAYGTRISGTYEVSMKSTGKQLLSLDRLWKEAKLSIGKYSQAVLKLATGDISMLLKSITTLGESGGLDEWGTKVSNTLDGIYKTIRGSIKLMWDYRKVILAAGAAWVSWRIVGSITTMVKGLNAAMVVLTGQTMVQFFVMTQRIGVDAGLAGIAIGSLSGKLAILVAIIAGFSAGYSLLKEISAWQALREASVGALDEMGRGMQEWSNTVIAENQRTLKEISTTSEEARKTLGGFASYIGKSYSKVLGIIGAAFTGATGKVLSGYAKYVDRILFFESQMREAVELKVRAEQQAFRTREKLLKMLGKLGLSSRKEFNQNLARGKVLQRELGALGFKTIEGLQRAIKAGRKFGPQVMADFKKLIDKGVVIQDKATNEYINLTRKMYEEQIKASREARDETEKIHKAVADYAKEIDNLGDKYLRLADTRFSEELKAENANLITLQDSMRRYRLVIEETYQVRYSRHLQSIKLLTEQGGKEKELQAARIAMAKSAVVENEKLLAGYRNYYSALTALRDNYLKEYERKLKELKKFKEDGLKTLRNVDKLIQQEEDALLGKSLTEQEKYFKRVDQLNRQHAEALQLTGNDKRIALVEYTKAVSRAAGEFEAIRAGVFKGGGLVFFDNSALDRLETAREEIRKTQEGIVSSMQKSATATQRAAQSMEAAIAKAGREIDLFRKKVMAMQAELANLYANILVELDDQASPAIKQIKKELDTLRDKTITITTRYVEERHTGGVIGSRYHAGGVISSSGGNFSGLAADEVPVIAQRGEGMVSKRGMRVLGRANLARLNRGGDVSTSTDNRRYDQSQTENHYHISGEGASPHDIAEEISSQQRRAAQDRVY